MPLTCILACSPAPVYAVTVPTDTIASIPDAYTELLAASVVIPTLVIAFGISAKILELADILVIPTTVAFETPTTGTATEVPAVTTTEPLYAETSTPTRVSEALAMLPTLPTDDIDDNPTDTVLEPPVVAVDPILLVLTIPDTVTAIDTDTNGAPILELDDVP